MTAIEFVKKFDLDFAKHAVANRPKDWSECYLREYDLEFVKSPPSVGNWVCVDDLKQIVEAWELVELHGSLKLANHYAMKKSCLSETHAVDDLWNAINLVEQCQ